MDVNRVDVDEVRRRIHEGDAILVCAYGEDAKCAGIEDAISYTEFQAHSDIFKSDQEIVLFCG